MCLQVLRYIQQVNQATRKSGKQGRSCRLLHCKSSVLPSANLPLPFHVQLVFTLLFVTEFGGILQHGHLCGGFMGGGGGGGGGEENMERWKGHIHSCSTSLTMILYHKLADLCDVHISFCRGS